MQMIAIPNTQKPLSADFKGNKQSLPQKPCVQCGRGMVWRKSWAKNWAEVKYCSDRCKSDAKSNKKSAA
jgi:hypothetical protein